MRQLLRQILVLSGLFLLGMVIFLTSSRQATPEQDWLLFHTCPNYQECELHRLHIDTAAHTKIANYKSGPFFEGYYVSGEWLYFEDDLMGDNDIYRARIDGTKKERLTTFSGDESPLTFTSDGEWLIFGLSQNAFEPNLHRMRPDGSDLTPITDNSIDKSFSFLQWFPYPEAMLLSQELLSGDTIFYRLPLNSWQLEEITTIDERYKFLGTTLDGQNIIIGNENEMEEANVLAIDIETGISTPIYQTEESGWIGRVGISPTHPNDMVLEVLSREILETYLYLLRLDGSGVQRLTPPGESYLEEWSSDGTGLLYYFAPPYQGGSLLPHGLYYLDIANPLPRLVVKDSDIPLFLADIALSPDGDWVLLSGGDTSGFWLVSTDGQGTIKNLLQNIPSNVLPGGGLSSLWSPDGQWVILNLSIGKNNNFFYRVNSTTLEAEKILDLNSHVIWERWFLSAVDLHWHRPMLVGTGLMFILASIGLGFRRA